MLIHLAVRKAKNPVAAFRKRFVSHVVAPAIFVVAMLMTVDLDTRVFTRTAPGAAQHERVGFTPESLRDCARKTVEALRTADPNEPRFDFPLDGRPSPGRAVELFTLAWACQ